MFGTTLILSLHICTGDGALFLNISYQRFYFRLPRAREGRHELHPLSCVYILTAVSLLECIGKKKNKVYMGNYVNSHLATEEHVVYEAHHHWCIWILPIYGFVFFSIPCLGVIISIPSDELDGSMFLFLFSLGLFGIWGLIYTIPLSRQQQTNLPLRTKDLS